MECRFIVIYMENHIETALNIIVNTFNDLQEGSLLEEGDIIITRMLLLSFNHWNQFHFSFNQWKNK